jgi:high-affinity iron transporter
LFPAFLLTLREALEAVLIIGIVLTTLRTTQRTSQQRYVWAGTVAGILLSVVIALALNLFGTQLEGIAEEIFEGTMMFLAAMVLTWMIFWMQNQSSQLSQQLRQQVKNADQEKRGFPLFSIAFLAIFREGLELSLFLTAASFDREQTGILTGFLIGMGVAIILGWALTRGLLRLNIRRFFLIVWDLNPWFDEKSLPGQLMTSLFGYNANPSLSEVMGSTAYFGGLLYILYRRRRQRPPIHPPPPHENQIGL